MDIWDALRVVMRRWYVTVPLLLITAVVATMASTRVDPEYSVQSSFVLVGPSATGPEEAEGEGSEVVNPYLHFNNSLATTAQVLQLSLSSSEARRTVAEEGLASNYEVTVAPRSPIVNISVTTSDPVVAVDTLDRVSQLLKDELDLRQEAEGVPTGARIGLSALSEGDAPTTDLGGQARVRLVFAGVGVAIAVAAAFLVEGLTAVLRRRQHATATPAAAPEPAPDGTGAVAPVADEEEDLQATATPAGPEPAPDGMGAVDPVADEDEDLQATATPAGADVAPDGTGAVDPVADEDDEDSADSLGETSIRAEFSDRTS